MKKTLTMFAILLTLCLVASAFAASSKKIMSVDQVMGQDHFYRNQTLLGANCIAEIVDREAFNHSTTSALYRAVYAESHKECLIHERMALLRLCELATPKAETNLAGACSASPQGKTKYLEDLLDRLTTVWIDRFDQQRATKGLPPRPSFDK